MSDPNVVPTLVSTKQDVGIIYPPETQKALIDKTAKFVAINGEEFEYKIIQKEGTNSKFNFLKPENPFHSYYKMSVRHFYKQIASKVPLVPPEAPTPSTILKNRLLQQKSKKKKKKKHQRKVPTHDPLPILFNLEIPSKINAYELDLIKLTALFVAKNGIDFLGVLAGRESRNRKFDFLKIGHKHFTFYSKLVDVYKMCLFPDQQTIQKVKFFAALENKVKILDIIYSKREWVDYIDSKRLREERDKLRESEQLDMIDWHDFVVVEVIDFDEITEDKSDKPVEYSGMNVVRNYERSRRVIESTSSEGVLRDPITGALIPKDKMSVHMKRQLIDPVYKKNKEREAEKFKVTNLADDKQLADQLNDLAKSRTDIFSSKKELEIGQKEDDDVRVDQNRYIWDGKKNTIPMIPPPPRLGKRNIIPPPPSLTEGLVEKSEKVSQEMHAMVKNRAKMAALSATSIATNSKLPFGPGLMQFNQNTVLPELPIEEPKKKRKKVGLVPAIEWEKKYKGDVEIQVFCPKEENKKGWLLNGQTLNITVDMTNKIYEVMRQIQEQIKLPVKKQKIISFGVGFLKASKTLSHYNFTKNHTLQLIVNKRRR